MPKLGDIGKVDVTHEEITAAWGWICSPDLLTPFSSSRAAREVRKQERERAGTEVLLYPASQSKDSPGHLPSSGDDWSS